MIDVSIIIPTYNKKRLLRLSLYALGKQTFDHSRFEVIVIDDGSTDGTWRKMRGYKPPYPFRYIRNVKNTGRAASRNKGIQLARGRVLIFLDAEILVEEDFIQKHWAYHEKEDMAVVSGVFGRFHGLYSHIHPSFNSWQFKHCYPIVRSMPRIRKRFRSSDSLSRYLRRRKKPLQLVGRKSIDNRLYTRAAFNKSYYLEHLVSQYGPELRGFHFPWISFLSGNVSVKKESFDTVGRFDENFKGYGFEDWELGYRYFLNGYKFIAGQDIVSYHQEHPYDPKNRSREHKSNHLRFFEKHRDYGIAMLVLYEIGLKNYVEINQALDEYYRLREDFPDEYMAYKTSFHHFCERLAQRKANDDHYGEYDVAFESDHTNLKRLGRYPQLVSVMELQDRKRLPM